MLQTYRSKHKYDYMNFEEAMIPVRSGNLLARKLTLDMQYFVLPGPPRPVDCAAPPSFCRTKMGKFR